MKFIRKWSYACAKELARVLNEPHRMKSIYYYGFQIIIGAMVKGTLLVSLSLLLRVMKPTLVCTLAFVSLRIFAGGCHMDTYGKCIMVSLAQFVATGMIAGYTYTCWEMTYLIALISMSFVVGLYTIIRYAPKGTPNKPISDPGKIKKFRKLSLICLFVWFAVTLALAVLNWYMYAIASCLGMLLELLAISPAGHKFYHRLKRRNM